MAIDMRDLPLGLGPRGDGEGFAGGGSKLALARRRVVDAWLDDDPAGLAGAIDEGERDLGADLDGLASFRSSITPLADEFRARRQLAGSSVEREEARSSLAATLSRLSQSVAASDDPARRDLLGREARTLLDTHRASGLLDPDDAETLAVEYDRGLGQAQAARIAREDPALAQQLLRDESLFPGLDPETRERYAKAAEARLAAPEDAADGSAAELANGVTARARAGADLARRLKTDRLTEGDVAAAESLGEIDAATARRLRRELEAMREAGRRLVEDLSRAESAFAEGRKFNPKDPLDRAAIDRHYQLIRKGWDEAGLSPEEVRPAIADYIAESGVIPSDIERKLPFYLDNGTAEQKWEAADLIRLLIDKRDFEPEQIAFDYRRKALGIAELVQYGYDPIQAVERYEQEAGRTTQTETDALAEQSNLSEAAQNALSRLLGEDPASGVAATAPQLASYGLNPKQKAFEALKKLLELLLRSAPPPLPPPQQGDPKKGEPGPVPAPAEQPPPTLTQPPAGEKPVPPPPVSADPSVSAEPSPKSPPLPMPKPVEEIPDIHNPPSGFSEADRSNLLQFTPSDVGLKPSIIVERNESPETAAINDEIRDVGIEVNAEDGGEARHTGGGRDKETGKEKKEEYLKSDQGKKDSSYVDITFTDKVSGRKCHVNSYTPRADGEPDQREDIGAFKILLNKETGDILLLVRKLFPGETLDRDGLKEAMQWCLRSIRDPYDPNSNDLDARIFNPPRPPSPSAAPNPNPPTPPQ